MANALNDTEVRPWSPVDVEATTQKMVQKYSSGELNHAAIMKMFGSALNYTQDEEKSSINSGEIPHVTQKFALHNPGNEIERFAQMPPLGGYLKGNQFANAEFKAVLDTSISGGTSGGGVLARVDLVAQIFVWLLTMFPALARVMRVPANGIDHSWNNLLDFGDATDGFIDEFGCPLPNRGTYFRGRTNIAILAVERGTSLKLEFATAQSGMSYNGNMSPYDLEFRNAVWSRAKIFQKCLYQGTTQGGHTAITADEFGTTFLNGFNGLRALLSHNANSLVTDFYPSPYEPIIVEPATAGTGSITDAIDEAAGLIMQNGGQPTAIHCSVEAARALRKEATPFVRYMMNDATSSGFVLGGHVRAIDTVAGELPLVVVPGNAIGQYNTGVGAITGGTTIANSTAVEDIYVLSEQDMALPYLGSPDPLPIEIPTGIPDASGFACLTRRFILYWMMGLAIYIPVHQAKVRIPVPTS